MRAMIPNRRLRRMRLPRDLGTRLLIGLTLAALLLLDLASVAWIWEAARKPIMLPHAWQ